MTRTILDTGPLVALLNRRDTHHRWATDILKRIPPPLWTCEPVLTEAAYLTGRPAEILGMLDDGALRIGLAVVDQTDGIRRLLDRYGDAMDLADACVVRLSELFRESRVLTLDRRGFSIYRRHGRGVVPLLAPEQPS